ncbi:MAG: hypothetical protein LUE29_06560 [Lachnospiraceae bacterium]|nr:hypothetical protein [Lachnospiraceae bacterium]
MIYIKKGKEPESLTRHRKQPFASYDNCNKDDIRTNLLEEQGHLCAYCMRRITKEHMKIEHWYPESKLDEAGRMDYSRMLGCCEGHLDGTRHEDDTCDTHKGDSVITLSPLNEVHIGKIKYRTGGGEIYSDDADMNRDLNETLNLNCTVQYLKENRKAVLDTLKVNLRGKGTLGRNDWERLLKKYSDVNEEGQKREYAGIVIWYSQKRLGTL